MINSEQKKQLVSSYKEIAGEAIIKPNICRKENYIQISTENYMLPRN